MTRSLVPCSPTCPTGARGRNGFGAAARAARGRAPDLRFGPLRGNIDTRLRKRTELGYDAVVVAYAALTRLGRAGDATDVLDPTVCMPQVGQGALAVECRADDGGHARTRSPRSTTPSVHRVVDAERAFLTELGGGCNLPCGALAEIDCGERDRFVSTRCSASLDGHSCCASRASGVDPVALGQSVARTLVRTYPGELAS